MLHSSAVDSSSQGRSSLWAGQGQAQPLRVVVVEAALVEEPPGLHTAEGHGAARGVLLPVLDALPHGLLDHLQGTTAGKLTFEPSEMHRGSPSSRQQLLLPLLALLHH